jgi:antitoxin component YwqK of YwqJK toxin-antitoxin module
MPAKKSIAKKHIEFHRDGSVWAKGRTVDDVPDGYWEWFRLDGTKMRSGFFENGRQSGDWTTYDRRGKPFKVTPMKPAAKKRK